MSNNSELTLLVEGIVNQRSVKLPQIEAQIEKLNQIETALYDLMSFSNSSNYSNAFATIPFDKTFSQIAHAKQALNRAYQRLNRKNIRIAVAGKARQGKSQLLQMLTGLGNEQIPAGSGTCCTAVRSRIINTRNNQSATVHFFTHADFLEKKIWPAYRDVSERSDSLGLSPKPNSVQEFLSVPLPKLSDKPLATKSKLYSSLETIHNDLSADPSIVSKLGMPPLDVPLADVVNYVTKDNAKLPNYYHVVNYVEIRKPFAVGMPDNMEVFDLPGLGEIAPNVRQTMLNAVKNDADIVFFLHRPTPGGSDWLDDITDNLDMISEIYNNEGIDPNEWISLILNLDRRPASNNESNVESMRSTAPRGFNPIVCDCGSREAVRSMISDNMQTLLTNARKIDNVCINRANIEFNQAVEAAKDVHSKLETTKGDVFSSQEINKLFKIKFEEFKAKLRSPFKSKIDEQIASLQEKIKNHLEEQFMNVYRKMEDFYKGNEDREIEDAIVAFPADFPIFSRKRIENKIAGENGPDTVIEEAVRNQLWSIVELMRSLMTQSCDKIRELYLDEMVKLIVDGNEAIKSVLQQENASPDAASKEKLTRIKNAIERVEGISTHKITEALNELLNLSFNYEQHILPIFYDNPSVLDFDPCYGSRNYKNFKETFERDDYKSDWSKQRDALYNWMKETSLEIISSMLNDREDSPSAAISHNIFLIIKANYRQFVNQFIWGETVEDEWLAYADNQKFVLWEEFNELAAKDKEFRTLKTLADALEQAITQRIFA